MDISVIKANETNAVNGLSIGSEQAAKVSLEFMNLRCPYCKKWFLDSKEVLEQAVKQEKIRRVIKLFDKEKPSLQRGNVMHQYVDTTNAASILESIELIYQHQDEWGNLSLEEVANYAENILHLKRNAEHEKVKSAIVKEAQAANIIFVPTIILDEHIFDENITTEELTAYINE